MIVSPRRLGVAVTGIGFAVVLMFMQLGFRNALFDSTVAWIDKIDADLIVVSKARTNLATELRFETSWLRRIAAVPGVVSSEPIYLERSLAMVRVASNHSRPIRVIGVPLGHAIFSDQELIQKLNDLDAISDVLVDRQSKAAYHFSLGSLEELRSQYVELSGKQVNLRDTVSIGTDFVHDATLIMSAQSIDQYFPWRNPGGRPLEVADLGLIRIGGNADEKDVLARVKDLAGNRLAVLTKQQFRNREIAFWGKSTPIGIIFSIGTVMGLVVGTIICYQILYTDISDHLPEFATLKAMGYPSTYFLRLIFSQSLYLTLLGFLPGLAASALLFLAMSQFTGLIMALTTGRIASVLGLTAVMCIGSGMLAVRRLWSADPASLF